MTSTCCCSKGLEISNNFYGPEFMLWNQSKKEWSKLAKVPLAIFTGLIKPALLPIWVLVGIVALPIIAIIRACGKGEKYFKHSAGDYLKAWSFSVLGLAGIVTVMALTSTVVPLIGMAAILLSAFTVSITIHVYRACQSRENLIILDSIIVN